MSEQATDGKQAFWDAAYLVALGVLMGNGRNDTPGIAGVIVIAEHVADKSLEVRSRGIAARSPEPEPAKPAKVKRVLSKRLPCPGGGARRLAPGYDKCGECGRVVGSARGRQGWYVAEHKLPAEVG